MIKKINVTDKKMEPRKRISKDQLELAAKFAFLEAGKWSDAIAIIEPYEKRFSEQICVMAMYAIELYLKAILMKQGILQEGHKVADLYELLDETEKNRVKKDIQPDGIVSSGLFEEYIELDSFEKELKYISTDFVKLRYEYEKFCTGQPIFICNTFISQLLKNTRALAKAKVLKEFEDKEEYSLNKLK